MAELKPNKRLLAHEKERVLKGELVDVSHKGASAIWLEAESTPVTGGFTALYRPMGDIEVLYLVENGKLPDTQPYQTVVEGPTGRAYAEGYLTGRKWVDSSPTTVVEFVVPSELSQRLFAMQSKAEDGCLSHGLGSKGGGGLPVLNASLRDGTSTWRIVKVKRPIAKRS